MTLQTPLFMQAGEYLAKMDRYLIGGSLYPKGGVDQSPRPGVRPFAVMDAASDSTERSFLVSKPAAGIGEGAAANQLNVNQGVAYVAGPLSQTLNGTYMVVNDGPATISVPMDLSGAVDVYVQIQDAEHGNPQGGPSSLATAVFVAQLSSLPAPENSLLLATAQMKSGVIGHSITDKRVFTTSHGGTVLVANADELSRPPMDTLPLGSSAYAVAQRGVYTRTLSGWKTVSTVDVGMAAKRPTSNQVPNGYQFFNVDTGTLETFISVTNNNQTVSDWYPTGKVPAKVRLNKAGGSYPGLRVATAYATGWSVTATAETGVISTTFQEVGAFGSASVGTKPSERDLQVRVNTLSKGTVVAVTLTIDVEISGGSGNAWVEVLLKAQKYSTLGGESVSDFDPYRIDNYNNWQRYGMRSINAFDSTKSRMVTYEFESPGEYLIKPVMRLVAGTADTRTVKFNVICVEVSV
jgi:hypothetical protein